MQANLDAKRQARESECSAKEAAAAQAAREVRVGGLLSSSGTGSSEQAAGASLQHDAPDQTSEHTIASQKQIIETLRAQLRAAGMVPAA